jgi:L-rhamnose mutarotase
MPQDYQTRLP